MTSPDGGFYSALDADSEHEEGKFYVWQREDVRAIARRGGIRRRRSLFRFRPSAEFREARVESDRRRVDRRASRRRWILPLARVAIARSRRRPPNLFAARASRIRPGLDDKILTSWNALMIARPRARIAHAARSVAADAGRRRARSSARTRVARRKTVRHDSASSPLIAAYLDDYAFLLEALIECLQSRWNARDLRWACQLADALLDRFEDKNAGGFFFTANDHEKLIQRPKPWFDEAIPSGNGVAARNLLRLGHLIGETRYIDAAERTLRASFDNAAAKSGGVCGAVAGAERSASSAHARRRAMRGPRTRKRRGATRSHARRDAQMFTSSRTMPGTAGHDRCANLIRRAAPPTLPRHAMSAARVSTPASALALAVCLRPAAQHARRQENHRREKREHTFHSQADQPERQQQQPHERIQHQRE